MSEGQISPSKDFTDKVMTGVKKRPRKIGLWNLLYAAPVVLALAIVSHPIGQESLLNLTNDRHVAVAQAEQDVAEIQSIVGELTQFEFDDETQTLINDESVIE